MSTSDDDKPTGNAGSHSTYYVLKQDQDTLARWHAYDKVQASSAEAAIRAALTTLATSGEGTFIAIPARSWKPVKVQAVQTTVLKLEDAGS